MKSKINFPSVRKKLLSIETKLFRISKIRRISLVLAFICSILIFSALLPSEFDHAKAAKKFGLVQLIKLDAYELKNCPAKNGYIWMGIKLEDQTVFINAYKHGNSIFTRNDFKAEIISCAEIESPLDIEEIKSNEE